MFDDSAWFQVRWNGTQKIVVFGNCSSRIPVVVATGNMCHNVIEVFRKAEIEQYPDDMSGRIKSNHG